MIAAPSSHLPEGIVRYPVPSHFDQAKHHHPIDVISTKRSARRNLPSSLPTGGDFSFPIISSVKPPFPGQICIFTNFVRKISLFPDELQYFHLGLKSKLQRQIAEGGIGSRKGKGPTKWEGPPAATAAANRNPPRHHANAEDITRNRTS